MRGKRQGDHSSKWKNQVLNSLVERVIILALRIAWK